MSEYRKVISQNTGRDAVDGAGVKLVRVLGYATTKSYDPFLMLDVFDSRNPEDYIKGFPWHPHRGIETVTYLIEGDIEHADSLGNRGTIRSGECQWMTAGSGIIHQEMPIASDRMLGAQLWLNLPAKDKMCPPAYGDITKEDIPSVEEDGVRVKIIAGDYKGHKGGFQGSYVKADYLDVAVAANSLWELETPVGLNTFIYVFDGSAKIGDDEQVFSSKQALLLGPGEKIKVEAGEEGIRFIFLMAEKLGEPIAWGGPIVMNTREELDLAFAELDSGDFIK